MGGHLSIPALTEDWGDSFALFGLPRKFRIDLARLDERYRTLAALTHPDRYAAAGEDEKHGSMQATARLNEAYQTLKKPLLRAAHLLALAGRTIDTQNNRSMPSEFLIEQMEWREAVETARLARDSSELERLCRQVGQGMDDQYERLAVWLDDEADNAQAEDGVKRLLFLDKLLDQIGNALDALENED